jgi:hypothetical protein
MPNGSFKSDESFLRKLSIGAAGTVKTFDDLRRQGHAPIELERGSMSFKIWRKTIKRKRIRMPDILCLRCARRFESRGKTDLAISMSHSQSDAQRAWDTGLDDGDFVAVVPVFEGDAGNPTDWIASDPVQYARVGDLRASFNARQVYVSGRKGVEEGSEIRITWPSAIAAEAGSVESVNSKTMRLRFDSGRAGRVSLERPRGRLRSLIGAGQRFHQFQVLASVVALSAVCPCAGGATVETYISRAASVSLTDRYMAVKALKYFDVPEARLVLAERLQDPAEDIYVKVEAGAALLARGDEAGGAFFDQLLTTAHASHRLEGAIVLGDVGTTTAGALLRRTLADPAEHPDVRAAAAWSLGEIGLADNIDALIGSFAALELEVRIEAARALAKLARHFREHVVAQFAPAGTDRRPGIAWAIGRTRITVTELLPTLVDDDARHWVAYMVGVQPPEAILDLATLRDRDPEVYFAVTVLWKIFGSWIHNLEAY